MNKQQLNNITESVKEFKRTYPKNKKNNASYIHFVDKWSALYYMMEDNKSLLESIDFDELVMSLQSVEPGFKPLNDKRILTDKEHEDLLFYTMRLRDNARSNLNKKLVSKLISFYEWSEFENKIFNVYEDVMNDINKYYINHNPTNISKEKIKEIYERILKVKVD